MSYSALSSRDPSDAPRHASGAAGYSPAPRDRDRDAEAGESRETDALLHNSSDGVGLASDGKVEMQQLFNKVSNRLLPLFFVMVIMCYVDRTSLAFAAIQLNADLNFAPSVYGMGSGLFFLGYSLFQIPSNLLLRRIGGPLWLATIIAAWGLTASAFAGMSTATHFYALRLLLGLTEAGAFPGMWYVLTTFFPGDQITFPFAVVEAGISLSHVVAAPLAAACLSLDGLGGLAGWRWLFLVEGIPTLGLAVAMYQLLPRSPETAAFLTPAERRALLRRIEMHAHTENAALESVASGPSGSSTSGSPDGGSSTVVAAGSAAGVGTAAVAGGGGGVVKRATKAARGSSNAAAGGSSSNNGGAGGATADGTPRYGSSSSGGGGGGAGASPWHAVRLAVTNKYVWYLGAIKFVRDIASFGLIFWAPTIVNSLLQDMRQDASDAAAGGGGRRSLLGGVLIPPSTGRGGTGTAAVLLTAAPFALAACCGMALAHSSQRCGERFLHISLPYIVTGSVLTLYAVAADHSPWLGFAALSLGVIGVYCGSGPGLALLSELAAGPGLVVALPLYNSIGTMGGFLGPTLVGWLVQRARNTAASAAAAATAASDASGGGSHGGGGGAAAAIHGGGFGVSAVVLGSALCLAGLMTLALGGMLGRLGSGWEASINSLPCVKPIEPGHSAWPSGPWSSE